MNEYVCGACSKSFDRAALRSVEKCILRSHLLTRSSLSEASFYY